MNKTLAGGDDSTVKALNAAGLQFESIRAMAPEQAFNTIVGAIQNIPDPMTQARVAVELFGKAGQDLLPAIKEGFQRIGAEAYVMADGTINALEAAGDAIDRFKNVATTRLGQAAGAAVLAFEEISKGREGIANWWQALKESGGQDDKFIASLTKIRNAANALTEDQKALIKTEVENGESNELLSIGINANKESIIAYANSLRKATEEAKKAGQVQGATAEEVAEANRQWKESVKAAEAVAEANRKLWETYNSVGRSVVDTIDRMDGATVEAIKYDLQRGQTVETLTKVYGVHAEQIKAIQDQEKFLASVVDITTKSFQGMAITIPDLSGRTEEFRERLDELFSTFNQFSGGLSIAGDQLDHVVIPAFSELPNVVASGNARIEQTTVHAKDSIIGLATAFGQLGHQIGGTAGEIITASASIAQAFEKMQTGGMTRGAFASQAIGMGAGVAAGMIDTSGQAGTGSLVASGALQGAAAGSVVPVWGTAIGAGAGAIVGLIRAGKEWRQVIQDIGRDFAGIKVSDDFAQMISDLEDSTGLGSAQAITTQLDQLIKLSGGLDSKNLTLFTQKLHDAFSYIETKTMSVAQVTQVLDKNFADFAKAGTDSMGRLGEGVREIIRLDERFGTQSKAIAEYLKQQGAAAVTGFNAVVAGTADAVKGYAALKQAVDGAAQDSDALTAALTAQHAAAEGATQELSDLGVQAVASFAAAVASGTSMSDALTAIHPSLQTLKQSYADLGLDVDNVALRNLIMQDTILSGNPALASAISGLSGEMVALDNMGLLNVDTFAAMERTGYQMYVRLQASAAAAGGTTKDALLPMQDYLHQAEIQAKLLGIPLDDNTQELINQSTALGIWKDAGKTANDLLLDGMTRLVDKVSALIDNLNGVTNSINNIPRTVDINVQGHYIAPSIPDGGGGDVDWGGAQAAGGDYFVRRPTLFLAGESGPERATFSGGGKSGGGMSTAAMEQRLASIERLMRDQPRAMAIAVSDAVALRR